MPQENNTRKEGVKGCRYADSFAISAAQSGAYDYYFPTETSNGFAQQIINCVDPNYTTTYEYDEHNQIG